MSLSDRICRLDDKAAEQYFTAIAQYRLAEGQVVPEPNPALAKALAKSFELPNSDLTVRNGDLARTGLQVLADDLSSMDSLETLMRNPRQDKFGVDPSSLALVTAALVVLQTAVQMEADSKGDWKISISKPSIDLSGLKIFLSNLLPFLRENEDTHSFDS